MGTTPTEPGTTKTSRLYPTPEEALDRAAQAQGLPGDPEGAEAVAPAPAPTRGQAHLQLDAVGEDPVTVSRAEGRQALRAARRRRRRISIGCAVLIALCTIATVLIVDLARVRTSGLPATAPLTRMASPPTAAQPLLPRYESTATLDALAS